MEADDLGPFQAIIDAALAPAPAPPVPGRPSIAMAPVVSTPTPTAPTASRGVSSLTAHALDVKRQIADFRAAGLDDIADEMEADDFGPFQAIVEAALSPPVPGRPSIGIVPAASIPGSEGRSGFCQLGSEA